MAVTRTEKAILAFISSENSSTARMNQDKILQEAADKLTNERYQTKEKAAGVLKKQFALIEVQYNPLTLNFTATGGDTELDDLLEQKEDTVKQSINPGNVTLTMELIVDGAETRGMARELMHRVKWDDTRKVIFCWGNMVFPGEVTQVNTEYTMFASTGEPQMGKISITISQNSPEDSSYWKQAFETCFQTI